jgi:protein SCO1/2
MARSHHILRTIAASAIATVLGSGTAFADHVIEAPAVDSSEFTPPTHAMYKANGVTVDEHVGARVPLDATFRTQDGAQVTLGELLRGDLPTILTFNYSDCPMLCSLQLNGLSAALPALAMPTAVEHGLGGKQAAFKIGTQFRIVTIDLEPKESLEKLAKMRERYIGKLPEAQQAAARAGWTFVAAATPGDDTAIKKVAESVGFKYVYVTERAEWAHPAALIFLSTTGVVTRYVYGIEFEPAVMRESIVKAGLSESATAVGFMNRCYHFDPEATSNARAGVLTLRLGAVGFLVLLASGFGVFKVMRRPRRIDPHRNDPALPREPWGES